MFRQIHSLLILIIIVILTYCSGSVLKKKCPENFVLLEGKCYYIERSERVSWEEACDQCEFRNSKLLSIESQKEMNAINGYLVKEGFTKRDHPNGFWTSGNDLDEEGDFYWKTTGNEIVYANWYPYGDPNNWGGNENCVQLWYQGTWYMNDLNCDTHNKYICEVNALSVYVTTEDPSTEPNNESTEKSIEESNETSNEEPIKPWQNNADKKEKKSGEEEISDKIVKFLAKLIEGLRAFLRYLLYLLE